MNENLGSNIQCKRCLKYIYSEKSSSTNNIFDRIACSCSFDSSVVIDFVRYYNMYLQYCEHAICHDPILLWNPRLGWKENICKWESGASIRYNLGHWVGL